METSDRRDGVGRPAWPLLAEPPRLIAVILFADLCALAWVLGVYANYRPSISDVGIVAMLGAIAIVFEEGVARATRLQIRLSSNLKRNMTSVWAVAGAVALDPGAAVALIAIVFAHTWFRQWRPAGQHRHRMWFNAATMTVSALAARAFVDSFSHLWVGLPWSIGGAVSVVVVIVVLTAVNRGFVTLALLAMGARGRDLLGSRDENLIEIATLCLGGLVSLAVEYEPLLAVLVVAPMVTLQRGALVRELEVAAMTDSKTGLLNPLAWEQIAQRELARGQRDGVGAAVCLIDIDRFKAVNDKFGHLVGDQVLREVGRRIGVCLREYDSLGRFGGEEFAVVLPGADDEAALAVAQRVRLSVNEIVIGAVAPGTASTDAMSVSIGVAVAPIDGSEVSDLLRAADAALYRAKAGGRNQVQLAGRDGGLPDRVNS